MRGALATATRALLDEVGPDGHWVGHLSASALSTATAVVALTTIDRERHAALIQAGLRWLAANQNGDGGWGDTALSKSNISTTALCWAAFGAAGADHQFPDSLRRAEEWLQVRDAAGLASLSDRVVARYGKDRTFSVPILMTLALSGRL